MERKYTARPPAHGSTQDGSVVRRICLNEGSRRTQSRRLLSEHFLQPREHLGHGAG